MTTTPGDDAPVTAGEIVALAQAVGNLSRDVGSLRQTLLRAVEQAKEASEKADNAQDTANKLAKERLRSLFWIRFSIGALIIAFVVSAVVAGVAWHAYNSQQTAVKKQAATARQGNYQTCVERNNQTVESGKFLRDYILAVAKFDPAQAKAVAAVIAKYQGKAPPPPDCSRILKTNK